jgi:hypothetical protein
MTYNLCEFKLRYFDMGIIVNGTTIPENVANSLFVNGTNITQVIVNGVQVWLQQLNWLTPTYHYTAGWGGYTSYYQNGGGGGYTAGFTTSGNLLATVFSINGGSEQGGWISVDGFGKYSGNSSSPNLNRYTGGWSGIETSGNNIRMIGNTNGNWLNLSKGVGWSGGTSTAIGTTTDIIGRVTTHTFDYNTSGYSFRFGYSGIYGNWVDLS